MRICRAEVNHLAPIIIRALDAAERDGFDVAAEERFEAVLAAAEKKMSPELRSALWAARTSARLAFARRDRPDVARAAADQARAMLGGGAPK